MFEDIKKLFNEAPKDKSIEDIREDFFKQWLEHVKQSGQADPDLDTRVMVCAMFFKLLDDNISLLRRVEEIHAGISVGLPEWAKLYESKGYEVTEYSKNCQKKYCLGKTYAGIYTNDEMDNFVWDAHANILGLTLEEYIRKREEYPEDKKDFLEDE